VRKREGERGKERGRERERGEGRERERCSRRLKVIEFISLL
jgi:hypothetical protein